ncbi:hypothetical protein [Anaerotignum sp.]|uniref:hypothetical protein n=1 Tax=Anaerotignum sp. TaxID=2039241 RepID=UPI0037357A3C
MSNKIIALRQPDVILKLYGQNPKPLSAYAKGKLNRCKTQNGIVLSDIMQKLIGSSISAEVTFFNDDGEELYMEFPELAESYLALADDGQGDLWLLRLTDGSIVFFDHEKTEDTITSLCIDFLQFLQLADLIAQWEQLQNINPEAAAAQEAALWTEMKKIEPKLPESYPFRLS